MFPKICVVSCSYQNLRKSLVVAYNIFSQSFIVCSPLSMSFYLAHFTAPGDAFSPSLSLHSLVAPFSVVIYPLLTTTPAGPDFLKCSPNSFRVLSSPPCSSPWSQQHRSTNVQLEHSRPSPPRQKSAMYLTTALSQTIAQISGPPSNQPSHPAPSAAVQQFTFPQDPTHVRRP